MSIAAFREHLLTETLVSAFKHAKNPEKLFVGAVVQNCLGKVLEDGTIDTSGTPCLTGPKVVGKGKNGKDIVKKVDVAVDKNGIEDFCALPDYEKYCKNGQIRVLYMHDTDSLGPSMARYYASKLWGGENYFVQIDSHLRFAAEWDAKYIKEIKLTRNYPKSVLSSYPPGFAQKRYIPKRMHIDISKLDNETVIESPGCRLCNCATPPGEMNPIMHIKMGTKNYYGNETRPTQTPFIGAGLIFSHADFLTVVPFDPFLPCELPSYLATFLSHSCEIVRDLFADNNPATVLTLLLLFGIFHFKQGHLWAKKFFFRCVPGLMVGTFTHRERT